MRMYIVELYVKIRRAVMVEGRSEREVARYFGIHRKTVKKMCQYAIPPGYQHKKEPISPKQAGFTGIIDVILEADKQVHVKQRHTAVRILERLRDEHEFTGSLLEAIPSHATMSTKLQLGKKRCLCLDTPAWSCAGRFW